MCQSSEFYYRRYFQTRIILTVCGGRVTTTNWTKFKGNVIGVRKEIALSMSIRHGGGYFEKVN